LRVGSKSKEKMNLENFGQKDEEFVEFEKKRSKKNDFGEK